MKTHAPKTQRCAIYTRKSTEHNLDLAFNSLDAQREACEAYIKSQAHEGWNLAKGRYDDGGLSGASLDRPALQMLLQEIRARRIDIVVVYKVDRLTRSLADFAKLVELFDENGVSFVSVTQSFNTTSSMGRLTLNVLLSFAQFEREVIGERVRDKIAASKRKGIWVGGPVPLGYASRSKILHIVPDEAAAVRRIFERYLQVGSIGALVADLERDGIAPRGGGRFGVGALRHLLRNRFYIGEVVYRDEIHSGAQEPILDRDVFQAVQDHLDAHRVARKHRIAQSSALLTGLVTDDRGNRLSPSHTNKRGLRYRYYVSQAILQNQKDAVGSITRVSAPDLEAAVVAAVRERLQGVMVLTDREVVSSHISSVIIAKDKIDIEVYDADNAPLPGPLFESEEPFAGERSILRLSVPWTPRSMHRAKSVHDDGEPGISDATRVQILTAIAKARRWMQDIADDADTFEAIARREGCGERHIRFLAPLAFVSPKIVDAIDKGRVPSGLTISSLARTLPHDWANQEARLCG